MPLRCDRDDTRDDVRSMRRRVHQGLPHGGFTMYQNQQRGMHPAVPEWFPKGVTLLRDPTLNKGTAFSNDERDALSIRGLLPPCVVTQDEQVARVLENFRARKSNLEKYVNLAALHDRNEAL